MNTKKITLYTIKKLTFEKINYNTWYTYPIDIRIKKRKKNNYIVYLEGYPIEKICKSFKEAKEISLETYNEFILKYLNKYK